MKKSAGRLRRSSRPLVLPSKNLCERSTNLRAGLTSSLDIRRWSRKYFPACARSDAYFCRGSDPRKVSTDESFHICVLQHPAIPAVNIHDPRPCDKADNFHGKCFVIFRIAALRNAMREGGISIEDNEIFR